MKEIHVTKTFLPPIEQYTNILSPSWDSACITNRGQLVIQLEEQLKNYLSVEHLLLTTNGTLPLQIAIKVVAKKAEIITTPFSYVATTSSIVWENHKPVFVDIDPECFSIDERLIEEAINENTGAILVTHVFGNPCHVEEIAEIAKKYNIPVIYDAAHCFGVNYKGRPIFSYGDVSTCSFHATKVFHTGEGGGLFSNDANLIDTLFYHHNFGHKGQEAFQGLGINAKMTELQAALGLSVLPYFEELKTRRVNIVEQYRRRLTKLKTMQIRKGTDWNYAYYPVLFETESQLLAIKKRLNDAHVYPRRYFYPSLTDLPYVESQHHPVACDVACRVMCLPLGYDLAESDIDSICDMILASL